jgi:hypothetical protein
MKMKTYAELWKAAVEAAIEWIQLGDDMTPDQRRKFYAQIEELSKWTDEFQGHVRTRVMMEAVELLNEKGRSRG